MMISKTGRQATLALSLLAQLEPGAYTGAAQLADRIGAPRNYLGKLLKQLAEKGLLESQKGFGGGFRLARPAGKIRIYDILEPIDHVSKWNGCFLGRAKCSEKSPCSVHIRWSAIRNEYLLFLRETTVADIAENKVSI